MIVVAFAALLAACAPRFVRPDMAEHGFRELRSPHFVVVTDLDAADAAAHVARLESLWNALTASYAALVNVAPAVHEPVQVIHLADCKDFEQVIWKPYIGGFVMPSLDFEHRRTTVTCEMPAAFQSTIAHELAHDFNASYLGAIPSWLNEGLATYFESIEISPGRAVIGRKIPSDTVRAVIEMVYPKVLAMVGQSSGAFYDRHDRLNYVAAWKLVHLMINTSPAFEGAFRAYLGRLVAGERSLDAWTHAAGALQPEIDRVYDEYLYQPEIKAYVLTVPDARAAHVEVRMLGPAEADALWAALQIFRLQLVPEDERDLAIVDAQLAAATRADASWAELDFWRAVAAYELHDDKAAAVALLRRYVARRPDDVRGWLGLVEVQLDVAVPDGTTGLEAGVPPGLDAFEPDVRELLRRSTRARELATVAAYYLYRHQAKIGLNFAVRAIALDSSCFPCLDVGAALLYQSGHASEALAQSERAISLLSDGAKAPTLQARMARYREAIAAGH